jgi:hypothetical protein
MDKGRVEMLLSFFQQAAEECRKHGWNEAANHFNNLMEALMLEVALEILKGIEDDGGKGSIH